MSHNCHVEPTRKSPTLEEDVAASALLTLKIVGMGCPTCAMRVRNGLLTLNGVVAAEVDHQMAKAVLRYNADLVSVIELVDAVAEAGIESNHQYRVAAVFAGKPD